MKNTDHLHFRRGDWTAIALVAALAGLLLLCFLPADRSAPATAQVYHNGELVKTLRLDTDTTFTLTGDYTNQITVEQGGIAITDSDCPGRDCVHSGVIRGGGRSIVCLPNGVEVRVIAAGDGVDFVVG